MSRSKWKGPFISKKALKFYSKDHKKNISIWSRGSTIPALLINKVVFVHTGKYFKKFLITREKVGYKFGEFVSTRQYYKKINKK